MTAPTPSRTLRVLLAELVDYAGLFPPAALAMRDAVANYAAYLDSADAWALGRFVVPAARLEEFAAEAARYGGARAEPWRVSALVGEDPAADAARIGAFNAAHEGRFLVDVAEARAATPQAVADAARALGAGLATFLELPVAEDPTALLTAVKAAGARAKVRTGGVTPEAFPTTPQVARFIARCAELGVPFKATAGLHHPLRGEQPLTYAPDAPCATMFGFLNVFLAAGLARAGLDELGLARVLEERDPAAFELRDDGVRWRRHLLPLDELRRTRAELALAFGSCSFREPIDDLHQLALL